VAELLDRDRELLCWGDFHGYFCRRISWFSSDKIEHQISHIYSLCQTAQEILVQMATVVMGEAALSEAVFNVVILKRNFPNLSLRSAFNENDLVEHSSYVMSRRVKRLWAHHMKNASLPSII
jgi:hypothetical protein